MRLVFAISFFLPLLFCLSHKRINGEYSDDVGNIVIIHDTGMTYLRKEDRSFDTLLVNCAMNHCGGPFYQINNSLSDYFQSNKQVSFISSGSTMDSLFVIFDLPFTCSRLNIHAIVYNYNDSGIDNILENDSIVYPVKNSISFPVYKQDVVISLVFSPISPLDYDDFQFLTGEFLGLLYFNDWFCVPDGSGSVVYSNPVADNMLFKRLNIRGEYIQFRGSSLIWRNTVFYRR